MWFGEHGVLRGQTAISSAVSQRAHITFDPRTDRMLTITSDLGLYEGALDTLAPEQPFSFVLSAIEAHKDELPCGFDMIIRTDMSDQIGFGSSAAITACTVAGVQKLLGTPPNKELVLKESVKTIRHVQGEGSGADAAASIYAGLVKYDPTTLAVEHIEESPDITVVYSGQKFPTTAAIKRVNELEKKHPKVVARIFDVMRETTEKAVIALERKDWKSFGELMNIQHAILGSLTLSNRDLSLIAYHLRKQEGILGSKITGGGLGDCVLALGTSGLTVPNYEAIDTSVSQEGLSIE